MMNDDVTRKLSAESAAEDTTVLPQSQPAEDASQPQPTTVLPQSQPAADAMPLADTAALSSPATPADDTPAFSPIVTQEEVSFSARGDTTELPPPQPKGEEPLASAEMEPNPPVGTPSTQPQSAPSPSFAMPPVAGQPPTAGQSPTARAEIKFGLLIWGFILVVIGAATFFAPVGHMIDWGTVLVLVFALLGSLMLLLAGLTVWRDKKRPLP